MDHYVKSIHTIFWAPLGARHHVKNMVLLILFCVPWWTLIKYKALCKTFAFILYNLYIQFPHFIDEHNKPQSSIVENRAVGRNNAKLLTPHSFIVNAFTLSQVWNLESRLSSCGFGAGVARAISTSELSSLTPSDGQDSGQWANH